jgi:hypothetical protein
VYLTRVPPHDRIDDLKYQARCEESPQSEHDDDDREDLDGAPLEGAQVPTDRTGDD